jgi:hypothetical protein
LLPTRLLDGKQLLHDDIDESFRATGALFFRLVDNTLVAMRARFRSESGEGKPGRAFLQASVQQIAAPNGWASVPAGFLAWSERHLEREPDVVTVPAIDRINVSGLDYDLLDPEHATREMLEALEPDRQRRLRSIVHAMYKIAVVVVEPRNDTATNVGEFLADVGLGLTLMRQAKRRIQSSFRIAFGLSPQVAGAGLVLTSSARPTDDFAVTWDQLLALAEPHANNYSRLHSAVSAPLGKPRLANLGPNLRENVNSTRGSGSQSASVNAAYKPLPESRGAYAPQAQRRQTVHQEQDRRVSEQAISDGTPLERERPSRVAPSSERPSRESLAKVFDVASRKETRRAFEQWNPVELPATHDELLLGLLVGIGGRHDLLEWFTITELFLLYEQIHVSEFALYLDDRLARIISNRLHHFEDHGAAFLTKGERSLFHRWGLGNISSPGQEKTNNLDGGVRLEEEMSWLLRRLDLSDGKKSDRLSFCASESRSIFSLPDRQAVFTESRYLLRTELKFLERNHSSY